MPAGSGRWTAAMTYWVPAPVSWLLSRRDRSGLAEAHRRQAMGLAFLLLCAVLIAAVQLSLNSVAVVFWERGFARWRLDLVLRWVAIGLGTAWTALWLEGIALALLGSRRRVPLAGALGERPGIRRLGAIADVCGWTIAAAVVLATLHSIQIAGRSRGPTAPVHVLYDASSAPRWVFALGAWPMMLAAEGRWGPGAVAVKPFTPEALREATSNASILFVGTHGLVGRLQTGGRLLGVEELRPSIAPGKGLRLVYLAACHGGSAAEAWREAFRPAEVILFDRNSAVAEHIAWLWLRAPGIVGSMDRRAP